LLFEPAIFFLGITFATSTMSDNSEETLGQAIGEAIDETYQETPLMAKALPGILSQHLKMERKIWTKMFVMFMVLLTAIVLGILSIYWGADHSLQFNTPVLTVRIGGAPFFLFGNVLRGTPLRPS
jgi:hypothetical protein